MQQFSCMDHDETSVRFGMPILQAGILPVKGYVGVLEIGQALQSMRLKLLVIDVVR